MKPLLSGNIFKISEVVYKTAGVYENEIWHSNHSHQTTIFIGILHTDHFLSSLTKTIDNC